MLFSFTRRHTNHPQVFHDLSSCQRKGLSISSPSDCNLLIFSRQIFVNEVVLGTLFGIFIGPYFLGFFDPRTWTQESDAITLEVMRIVLATGLFAIGVELPNSYMARHAKSLLAMVIPTMAIGWIIVAGFASSPSSPFDDN
jgi:hypothetical protein